MRTRSVLWRFCLDLRLSESGIGVRDVWGSTLQEGRKMPKNIIVRVIPVIFTGGESGPFC